jgi:tRNA (guanine-N7-)-methyltransferase
MTNLTKQIATPALMRKIRSFVRRDGRMTAAQRLALETCWPQYGLNLQEGFINFDEVFKRQARRVIEIGFGSGYSLLAAAKAHPDHDFIGIETHQPGIGTLLHHIQAEQLNNIRIYYADAVEVLNQCISNHSIDIMQIFFPDPWRKRRHHKRRLIQPEFVSHVATKLKPGGELHLATDWEDYALHMMKVLSAAREFENAYGQGNYAARSSQRPIVTKFEQRGENAGHKIWELLFKFTSSFKS